MSALEPYAGPDGLRRALDVLRDQIAPEATPAELDYFGQVCRRLDLDPFAGQIVLIGRFDKRVGRKVHRHQITVAGRRAIAARTGALRGIEGPVWCGPREDGQLVWREVWDSDDFPYAARCLVYVRDWDRPANGTCKWSEFAQEEGSGQDRHVATMWARMPSHMLGKVAESLALRRGFPEVEQAVSTGWPGDALLEADDADVMAEASAPDPATGEIPPSSFEGGRPDAERYAVRHTEPAARLVPPEIPTPAAAAAVADFDRRTVPEPAGPPPSAARVRAGRPGPSSWDKVPDDVYDSEPDAYGPDDPGRPF